MALVDLECLDHVGLSVADVDRSVAWYRDVLGLRRTHQNDWGDFPAVMEAHGTGVALFPRDAGDPAPFPDEMRHVGFRTSRTGLAQARADLTRRGIAFRDGDYGVARSIYLPDPDGYVVEITTYETA